MSSQSYERSLLWSFGRPWPCSQPSCWLGKSSRPTFLGVYGVWIEVPSLALEEPTSAAGGGGKAGGKAGGKGDGKGGGKGDGKGGGGEGGGGWADLAGVQRELESRWKGLWSRERTWKRAWGDLQSDAKSTWRGVRRSVEKNARAVLGRAGDDIDEVQTILALNVFVFVLWMVS